MKEPSGCSALSGQVWKCDERIIKRTIKMIDKTLYVASAGQTHIPFQDNEGVPFVPFEKPAKPELPLAPLELTQ
jgi:hypothetical protein